MSNNISLKALIATLMVAGCGLAHADVFVIANSAVQITPGEVKDVFTGEKQVAGSTKLVPVDNAAAQPAFLSNVLKMEADRYKSIWTKKSFREGMVPPAVKSGDTEVVDFVKKTPGGVGYVSSQPSGVNIIQKY